MITKLQVQVILEEKEIRWLKEYLQNHDPDKRESPEDRSMREDLWNGLSKALREKDG